jgi:hypothetical protein
MLEPINKQERIIAQRKFIGVYLLSILIPVIATYFWTRSTSDKLQDENVQYKKLIVLLGRVDTLGNEMKKLYAVDKEFNTNVELKEFTSTQTSSIKQSEDLITLMMVKVKADSAVLMTAMAGENKAVAAGIIKNYNIYYDFWSTLKTRGEALKNKGIDLSELERLKSELQMAQLAAKTAEGQVQIALASKSGGGGGGGASCEKYIVENVRLKGKIEDLEEKINELQGKSSGGATVVVTNSADINLLETRRLFSEADCDKKRADDGRKRKSKREIEELYNDSYKKFKDLIDKTTNAEMKMLAQKKMEEIKKNMKNIPPED